MITDETPMIDRKDVAALLAALERLDKLDVQDPRPAEVPLPLQRAWDKLLQMQEWFETHGGDA